MYIEEGGNLDMALQLARSAKAELPNRPEINDTLGWAFYKKGQFSSAVSTFIEAIGKAPEKAGYHYHLGLAYVGLGDTAKARESFQQSLSLDSTSATAEEVKKALSDLDS
jgi:Flp pilus assembly protein TadD